MRVSIFAGDICDVQADALCSSTNPRLSLFMGTGASVRGRGGFQISKACEGIVEAEFRRTGKRGLAAGSAQATTAGDLPSKIIVHCVASDEAHHSSPAIIRDCVRNALAVAAAAGCSSIAIPLFATGHAHYRFDQAVVLIAETLRDQPSAMKEVVIVVYDPERADDAARLVRSVIPGAAVPVQKGPETTEEEPGMWSSDWADRYGY